MNNKKTFLTDSDIETFESLLIQKELFTWEDLCRHFFISKTQLKILLKKKGWSLSKFRQNNYNIILDKTKKERLASIKEKKEKTLAISASHPIVKKPKLTMKIVKETSINLDLNPSLRLNLFKTESSTFIIKFMTYKKFLSMASIASYCGFSREYIRRIFLSRKFKFKDFKVKVKKSLLKN